MSKYGKPIWQYVEDAARSFEAKTFTPIEIIRKVQLVNPMVPENTIRDYVIAMAPNHSSSHHHPSTQKLHGILNYLGNGNFALLGKSAEIKAQNELPKAKNHEKAGGSKPIPAKIDVQTLKRECENFKQYEGRASLYDIALEIIDAYPFQAVLIILATWNVSRWRFMAANSQRIVDLKNTLNECKPLFEQLKNEDFKTANFDQISLPVKEIYAKLSKIKGVEFTGGSKVMHLFNRNLFVMWDQPIREEYNLGTSGSAYLTFLKLMQQKISDIQWSDPSKTLAKAIDEYNQATITIPKNTIKYGKKTT
jgi:hypothetical protein